MGTFYSNNDYRNYLAHHGVKGMKWGVRRYMNADGTLTAAGKARAKRDGTGLLARTKIRAQGHFGDYAEIARGVKNAKGVRRKLSAALGSGKSAALHRNYAYTQARLREASKTKLGKHWHDTISYNANNRAKKSERMQNAGSFSRWANAAISDVPLRTLAGRPTTAHRRAFDAAYTAGLAGPVLDAKYLYDKHRGKNTSTRGGRSKRR